MTDEKYRPTTPEDCLARLAEECAEVIKVVCKMQRFGVENIDPVSKKSNMTLLLEELNDIDTAKNDFLKLYNNSGVN